MKCVNIQPFDLDEKEFGDGFEPHLLDFAGDKKKKMNDSVVGVLKKVTKISNTNIKTERPVDSEMESVGKNRSRIPESKFKVSYDFYTRLFTG